MAMIKDRKSEEPENRPPRSPVRCWTSCWLTCPSTTSRAALTIWHVNSTNDNNRVPGDPSTWQSTLESDIAALSAKAGELPGLLGRVTGAAETKRVKVTVNAGGGLLVIRFRPRCFSDIAALNANIATVLPEARGRQPLPRLPASGGWVTTMRPSNSSPEGWRLTSRSPHE